MDPKTIPLKTLNDIYTSAEHLAHCWIEHLKNPNHSPGHNTIVRYVDARTALTVLFHPDYKAGPWGSQNYKYVPITTAEEHIKRLEMILTKISKSESLEEIQELTAEGLREEHRFATTE